MHYRAAARDGIGVNSTRARRGDVAMVVVPGDAMLTPVLE